MTIPRQSMATTGAGTFQVWLFETTGVISFVYGNGMAQNFANGGYTVGLQSGAATNFASVTTQTPTISYVTANNTQSSAITGRTSYSFTPNVPNAPTGLSFTNTTAVSTTLSWTDNSGNETGYAIYNSIDGTKFNFVTETLPDTTSQNITGLKPGTNYFWRVFAVSEGALSAPLTGSNPTNVPGNISSLGSGGSWSSPTTWSGGVVPTASDNVTIANGSTVIIDTVALAVSLPSMERYNSSRQPPAVSRSGQAVLIAKGGIFSTELTTPTTVTNHVLSLGGDLTNNGTLDFCTQPGFAETNAGASIVFTGTDNATFSASGAANTDIRALVIDKGNSPASTVELNFSNNFTVCGANSDVAGFLTLNNGTFKISGSFPMTNRVFSTPAYIIPVTAGIWLNNPNFTVAGTASGMSTANNGLFRVTQGTYNIGVGAGDEIGGGGGSAVFIVEGGAVNAAGRFDPQGPVSYTQTGGAVHVATVGNTRPFYGSFEIFNPSSSFIMTGGSITLHNPNTGSTPVDYDVLASTVNIDNTLLPMLILGDSGTSAGTSFHVQGTTPNLQVNTGMTLVVTTNASPGFPLYMRGASVLNSGAIIASGAGARFDFAGTSAMSYSGLGTFGSAVDPFGGDGISSNSASPITVLSPIVCNRVNLFQGGFIQSNNITLGNGDASGTNSSDRTTRRNDAGGSFDVAPVHNQGTGGETLLYMQESVPRITGLELNASRALASMTVDNTNNLTIGVGDLTVTNAGLALNLANGRVITGANMLVVSSGAATVAHTHGYVDGTLRKTYAAPGNKVFEVGTANGFSPVVANVTAASFPANLTATAIQAPLPNIATPATALQRYWIIGATGVTASLVFNYLDPIDIPPTATEARFAIYKYDGVLSAPGGEVNPFENLAITLSGNAAGSWTLAERTTTVTSESDSGAGSLRQVVIDALPGDVISFNLGNGSHTVTLASEIPIDRDLTIIGSAANPTSISGGGVTRVFNVAFGKTASLGNLTIANGNVTGDGGGVLNNGDLSLRNCTFTNNNASANGGAVHNDGTLKVQNSTFSDNHAASGDGGAILNNVGQSLTLGNVTMVKNSAGGDGGGISSAGILNLKNSIVALNNAGTPAITSLLVPGSLPPAVITSAATMVVGSLLLLAIKSTWIRSLAR